MPGKYPLDAVIVSDVSFASDDPYDIILSHLKFLNAMFEEGIKRSQVSVSSLQSYYVDFFRAQYRNGGFSQFVYNSGWHPALRELITDGFEAMGAVKHLALFQEISQKMETEVGEEKLQRFLADYMGEEEIRKTIYGYTDGFYELDDVEDLVDLNAQWLRQLPNLIVLSLDEMYAELELRKASVEDA